MISAVVLSPEKLESETEYIIFLSSVKRVHFPQAFIFQFPWIHFAPRALKCLDFILLSFLQHICYLFLIFHWYCNSFGMNPSIFNATL